MNAVTLKQQIELFMKQGLFTSAELLAGFLLSASGFPSNLKSTEPLILYANALVGKEEYKRALTHYQMALNALPHAESGTDEVDIRHKMAQCHLKLNSPRSALHVLEAINPRSRPLHVNVLLGSLYHQNNVERSAIASYKEALRQNPYAVEAALGLIRLGVSPSEVKDSVGTSANPWVQSLVEAHGCVAQHQHQRAAEMFGELEAKFPSNVHLLLQIGKCKIQLSDADGAIHCFAKSREVDASNVECMDTYASLIRTRNDSTTLNRLTQDMLSTIVTRPEPWICAALYSDLKTDKEKALELVKKGLSVDDSHVLGHLLKGSLCLAMGKTELAISAYRRAYELSKDLASFQGLVDSYLAVQRCKEALCVAKEALQLMPRNPKSWTLFGIVLSHSDEGRPKARRAFLKALSIDRFSLDAVMSLVHLYVMERQFNEAVELLKQYLQHFNKDFMHTKLADVLTMNSNYSEALQHYHTALSLNPNYAAAKRGLDRLEKLLRGVDPDAEEENEENDEGEAEDSFDVSYQMH
eukprot:GILK01007168.1.p1 GENE.GILK01007168.1~~GILK01007168.1.p1  ORF type:complete len:544 (-),score=85.06 GILK01007168.1:173-1747(-)